MEIALSVYLNFLPIIKYVFYQLRKPIVLFETHLFLEILNDKHLHF